MIRSANIHKKPDFFVCLLTNKFIMYANLLPLILGICLLVTKCGATDLQHELESYVDGCGATVGVAVISDCGDTITVNNTRRYPMNSVMKLHQAMAVTAEMDRCGISPDSIMQISTDELHPDTWSPLREKYLPGCHESIALPIRTLMTYALQQSDNNACDILFDHIVGIDDTDSYIRTLGIDDFAISVNERMMHADPALSAANYTTPEAAAALIHRLFTTRIYSTEYQSYLTGILTQCATGVNRLPAPLPEGTVIGHKTGTGFADENGHPTGINDVGFIRLPDGQSYAIAVFVDSCSTDMAGAERIIADISAIVANQIVNNR